MGEFRLALGGTIDVATPAELDDAVTGLQGHIDKKFASQKSGKFIWRDLSASISSPFSGGGSIQLPLVPSRPATGKVWSVRRFTLLGNDDHTTVSNITGALYAGDPANFNLTQCIIPGQIIPYFNTFGTGSMPLKNTADLFVNFVASGTVAFQTLVASVTVIEWDDNAIEMQHV
jgi:hypothetical protein